MANTYVKKQTDHPSDYNLNNNGGLVVGPLRGSAPVDQVNEKVTETPTINKTVVEVTLTSYEDEPIGKLTP